MNERCGGVGAHHTFVLAGAAPVADRACVN